MWVGGREENCRNLDLWLGGGGGAFGGSGNMLPHFFNLNFQKLRALRLIEKTVLKGKSTQPESVLFGGEE